jgi:hypothetical protein
MVCLVSRLAIADVFWRVADNGPATPDIKNILGDDSRTLAFEASGVYEYRFGNWERTQLTAPDGEPEVPGIPFWAGGSFHALSSVGYPPEQTLWLLTTNTWRKVATFASSADQLAFDAERLYAISGQFNDCGIDVCPSGASQPRLFTISLTDGTRRDGPLMPSCFGRIRVAGGVPYFVGLGYPCAVLSARQQPFDVTTTAIYRLDGGTWTVLPPLTGYVVDLFATSRGLWIVLPGTNFHFATRLLNASGLSAPVLLPLERRNPVSPVEWGDETLYVTDDPSQNVFRLRNGAFVPFDPLPSMSLPLLRHIEVYAAGSRLFAAGDGWNLQVLSGGGWSETTGIVGTPAADVYLVSPTAAFASRGGSFWKRGPAGWTRLPTPAIGSTTFRGVAWQERPVLVDESGFRLIAYSDSSGRWADLGLPSGMQPGALVVSGSTLCAADGRYVACLWDGTWTVAATHFGNTPPRLRDVDGTVFVISYPSAFRFVNGALEAAFPDLPSGLYVRDVVSSGGGAYVLVTDSRTSSPPGLRGVVVRADAGYAPALTDYDDTSSSFGDPSTQLSVTDGRLFISRTYGTVACTLHDGQLRQARGGAPIRYMDPAGLFASTGTNDLYARGVLLLPATRVRKTLPAAVDTYGRGGVHFRTTITLANFSTTRSAIAHVTPGAFTDSTLDVDLPPMSQRRVADPFPGFVGPVAVDFDGLDEEREAWASARVFSAVGDGTAGTSIDAFDPGSNAGTGWLLPLAATPSSRSHIAAANAGDGAGLPLVVSGVGTLAAGELRQDDPDQSETSRAIPISSWTIYSDSFQGLPTDDGLAYAVRNDNTTNDGTVVPMEGPELTVSRRTRFLPVVVSLSTGTATFKTEMRLARRLHPWSEAGVLPYHVVYRSAPTSGSFDVSVDALQPLDIPDVANWLVANGVSVDPRNLDGTLTFTSDQPEGAADLLVTAAVFATPADSGGDFGVAVPLVDEGRWASTAAIAPGLLEDGAFRSNLALANPEPPGGPSTTLSVTLHRAADGTAIGSLPLVTLRPGERYQFNRVSHRAGLIGVFDGYAVVQRTGGSGRFVAYGVLNDEVTSDGTFLPMTRVE